MGEKGTSHMAIRQAEKRRQTAQSLFFLVDCGLWPSFNLYPSMINFPLPSVFIGRPDPPDPALVVGN
jgi:hypothetical protein